MNIGKKKNKEGLLNMQPKLKKIGLVFFKKKKHLSLLWVSIKYSFQSKPKYFVSYLGP